METSKQTRPQAAGQSSLLINLINLSRRARRAEDALSLQFILANESFSLTPYVICTLWLQGEGVVSVSGVSTVDRHSPFSIWLSKLSRQLHEQVTTPARIGVEMLSEEDRKEWAQTLPAHAIWVPSAASALQPFGVLFARNEPWRDDELALVAEWVDIWRHAWEKLHAPSLQGEIAKAWSAVRRAFPSWKEIREYSRDVYAGAQYLVKNPARMRAGLSGSSASTRLQIRKPEREDFSKENLRENFFRLRAYLRALAPRIFAYLKTIWVDKRRRYVWLFWIIVLFPVRLTVLAPAELVPANPAVIRVPIEGVVDEFFVTPNQRVSEGDPLFRLDLTSLTAKLQVAQQEIQIATAELRQSTLQSLSDQKSKRMIAPQEGRAAERRLEAGYLKELLEKAQIKAPRAGVVLFDDPSEWIGRPVVAGERVMVVATEGDVEIEAWIPISDAIELAGDAPVTLYLNAAPLSPVNGTLRYLGHEALQRPDGSYAYRLRASLVQGESSRRVGLKGTVRVSGQFVPLSYWVFRKPIAWLRQFFGI